MYVTIRISGPAQHVNGVDMSSAPFGHIARYMAIFLSEIPHRECYLTLQILTHAYAHGIAVAAMDKSLN